MGANGNTWMSSPLKESCALGAMLLSIPIFNNIHHTLSSYRRMKSVCQSNFHSNQQTAPHTYCIVTISTRKYTHSVCSMSAVRICRQETAAEHWGIYWAIILGGIVNCGPMFTKHVIMSIWDLFYFYLIQYSSLRLNTNPTRRHDHPSTKV